MKGFLKKRWHRIPVALVSSLLVLLMVAGGVLAAYNFLSGTVEIEVEEAMTVSYDWPGDGFGWIPWDGSLLTITDAYPGESVNIGIQIVNESSAALTVNMVAVVTGAPPGGWDDVTVTGGPAGVIAGNTTWAGTVVGTISGEAPPGDYVVTLTFTRE